MCSDGSLNVHCIGATDFELDDLEAHAKEKPDSLGRCGNEHWMFGSGLASYENFAMALVWTC
jgi:hypothetical protein